uniref:V-myb avian myeloblastosis viral oncogene homolog-like 1 n=1 Tax=Petromyzon marinus TaxID=7757 RepID=S4R9E1_PETMA
TSQCINCLEEEEEDEPEPLDHDYDVPQQHVYKRGWSKARWTREEDERLKQLAERFGTDDWKFLANYMPNRSDAQCIHRWQKVLNPALVKGPWTKEEDQKVIELVMKYGPKRWSLIAKQLKGRIGKQCRERWHNHLNPAVKKSSWTEEEDRIIHEAHKQLGNRWAEIAKLLAGRTDNAIKNHWNSTLKRKVEQEGYLQDSPWPLCPDTKFQSDAFPVLAPDSPSRDEQDVRTHLRWVTRTQRQTPPPALAFKNYTISDESLAWAEFNKETESIGIDLCIASLNLPIANWPVHQAGGASAEATTPIKYLAVAQLSPLKNVPEFAETLQMIDSDNSSWSDSLMLEILGDSGVARECSALTSCVAPHRDGPSSSKVFSLHCPSSSISSGSTSGIGGKADPIASSAATARLASQPAILRRGRDTTPRGEATEGASSLSFGSLDLSRTPPKSNRLHTLPFSPSQFLNTTEREKLQMETPSLTSTPVCRQKLAVGTPLQRERTPGQTKQNGFRTPNIRCSLMETTPRTPTPFKNALAAQEVKYGPLKGLPRTPSHLEEDLRDVLQTVSASHDGFTGDSEHSPSPANRPRPEARMMMGSPAKKARKSLVLDVWSSDNLNTKLFPCEPSVSPGGSPSCVCVCLRKLRQARELLTSSLLMRPVTGRAGDSLQGHERTPCVMNSDWEVVAFGRTEDQLLLTEQARKYMKLLAARTLIL